mmetsp:Transcript_28620/g.37500  ORF Transcript_28620/g.37500 Transcript_28620/m.37500 type:complete len:87 (-) Transcript_28620:989-1249(-)
MTGNHELSDQYLLRKLVMTPGKKLRHVANVQKMTKYGSQALRKMDQNLAGPATVLSSRALGDTQDRLDSIFSKSSWLFPFGPRSVP